MPALAPVVGSYPSTMRGFRGFGYRSGGHTWCYMKCYVLLLIPGRGVFLPLFIERPRSWLLGNRLRWLVAYLPFSPDQG